MATATMAMTMEVPKTLSTQEKWAQSDTFTRQLMLREIGYSSSFASTSWKKLPYMVKTNLEKKTT